MEGQAEEEDPALGESGRTLTWCSPRKVQTEPPKISTVNSGDPRRLREEGDLKRYAVRDKEAYEVLEEMEAQEDLQGREAQRDLLCRTKRPKRTWRR